MMVSKTAEAERRVRYQIEVKDSEPLAEKA